MDLNILTYLSCICFIFIIGRIFIVPIKKILKLIFNSILGGIIIYVINLIGANFGFHIGLNIVNSVKKIFNIDILDYVIGGLHLVDDPIKKTPINNMELDEVAKYLNNNVLKTYGCHCTGEPAYNYLNSTLNNKIEYLRTGSEISI